ncbi:hypothetical protein M758_5G087200 [Ceratodon purpureus]|nr:hypothetical protein M758_5G087200 [Ceratodon purpureus]
MQPSVSNSAARLDCAMLKCDWSLKAYSGTFRSAYGETGMVQVEYKARFVSLFGRRFGVKDIGESIRVIGCHDANLVHSHSEGMDMCIKFTILLLFKPIFWMVKFF